MENKNHSDDKKSLQTLKIALGLVATLLVIVLISAISLWAKSNKYENEHARLVTDISALDITRDSLEGNLTSLEVAYDEKITENEQLTTTLVERVKEVEDLQQRIQRVRAQLAKSQEVNEEINGRLVQLEELKTSLENDIVTLQGENLGLRAANTEIATELTLSKEQIAALTEDIQKLDQRNDALVNRLYQLAPAGFIANNFKVTAMRKNDRVTAKAGRANEIRVSFDLKDVPDAYQKDEELYLVITKFDGNPVNEIETKNVKVKSASPIDIAAADIEQIRLKALQSVEMSFSPGRKFEAGLYNALVYADHGFLGATSFELQ